MVGKRVVVKLGGSVLRKPEDFTRIAKITKEEYEQGHELLLVVSAMGGHTDELLKMARTVGANKELLDSVAGLGETLSARLMAAALESEGVPSIAVDPSSPRWPIITNDKFGDADPDLPKTCGAAISHIDPLLGEVVPVISGYVGKTKDGRLTTLGRGGSDTTAVTLARCLNADEVVLVKDSDGIMNVDPKMMGDAVQIEELNADEALVMSLGGAKVLHHKALRYLAPALRMRVVSVEKGRFTKGGTIVHGYIPDLHVEIHERPVRMVTLLTNGQIPDLSKLDGVLSISTLDKATIIYMDDPSVNTGKLNSLVREGGARALAVREGVAMIKVWGSAIEEIPGVIHKIAEPLASLGINIFGLQTVHNKIAVFVDWNERERAAEELREILT